MKNGVAEGVSSDPHDTKPHQCPSHQPILLTQRPINEIFTKNILKNSVFLSRPIWNLKIKNPHENQLKLLGYQGWVEILMITLVYSKRVSVRNNLLHSVIAQGRKK